MDGEDSSPTNTEEKTEEKKQETSVPTAVEKVGNEKNISFVVKETLYPKNEHVKTPKETIIVSEETNKAELEARNVRISSLRLFRSLF